MAEREGDAEIDLPLFAAVCCLLLSIAGSAGCAEISLASVCRQLLPFAADGKSMSREMSLAASV